LGATLLPAKNEDGSAGGKGGLGSDVQMGAVIRPAVTNARRGILRRAACSREPRVC